jgi:hypothetical protein
MDYAMQELARDLALVDQVCRRAGLSTFDANRAASAALLVADPMCVTRYLDVTGYLLELVQEVFHDTSRMDGWSIERLELLAALESWCLGVFNEPESRHLW